MASALSQYITQERRIRKEKIDRFGADAVHAIENNDAITGGVR